MVYTESYTTVEKMKNRGAKYSMTIVIKTKSKLFCNYIIIYIDIMCQCVWQCRKFSMTVIEINGILTDNLVQLYLCKI